MKIVCEKDVLCDAAAVVSRAVSSRSALPSLEGILFRATRDGVQLFGYDLETGISTRVDAKVEEEGEIVLPAKVLLDIIKKLPGEMISIRVGERCLTEIVSGASEFTILGIESDDFPEFPDLKNAGEITLPQPTLRSMIDQTLFAVSQSDAKPIHTGSLFSTEQGCLELVSVDGFRLALRKEPLPDGSCPRFVVPGHALGEIARILSEDPAQLVTISMNQRHSIFKIGDFQILTRLLEGDFIDYHAAIPQNHTVSVRVNTRSFQAAVERVGLIISDRVKSPLRVKFFADRIDLNCSTALGRANDSIGAVTTGEPLEMGFNHRYLLDALRASQCDEVELQISGPLSPMKVVPVGAAHFLFLVLPVRLKTEG